MRVLPAVISSKNDVATAAIPALSCQVDERQTETKTNPTVCSIPIHPRPNRFLSVQKSTLWMFMILLKVTEILIGSFALALPNWMSFLVMDVHSIFISYYGYSFIDNLVQNAGIKAYVNVSLGSTLVANLEDIVVVDGIHVSNGASRTFPFTLPLFTQYTEIAEYTRMLLAICIACKTIHFYRLYKHSFRIPEPTFLLVADTVIGEIAMIMYTIKVGQVLPIILLNVIHWDFCFALAWAGFVVLPMVYGIFIFSKYRNWGLS